MAMGPHKSRSGFPTRRHGWGTRSALIRTDARKTNAGHMILALARSDERHAPSRCTHQRQSCTPFSISLPAIAASRLFRALEELGPGPTAEMFAAGRHSRRSASIGCTCAARRAGIQLAPSATINSRPAALDSVIGSDDPMPAIWRHSRHLPCLRIAHRQFRKRNQGE